MVTPYGESFGVFSRMQFGYNHDSPRGGESSTTGNISKSPAEISLGLHQKSIRGSQKARRDWDYASEHVQAIWQLLHGIWPTF
ncbi:GDP-mannose 4,6-dehydratase [Rosistilla oblonga]|uniref:GDP-mannose 4,6-dehydratase n=1 Tax=Rosistilla oblonga TaxID=2527990 RepID=UPI003A973ACC